ncbi:MAG: thioredoxin domain-containing protein [Caulobacteraceae bacterium]
MRLNRRAVAVLALSALLAACQPQKGRRPGHGRRDEPGDPNAKVTVIEYASAGCPFCGRFNNEVFPAFKAKYIDTGKIHYVFREVLVGGGSEIALGAAGFLTARCAGKDRYFTVLDQVFHDQEAIYKSGDIKGGLLKIAKANGMSDQQFTECVNNNDALVALNTRSEKAAADGVAATPTFFVNGKKAFESVPSLAELDSAIAGAS